MNAIKLAHITKRFNITNAQVADAHTFHQLIAATCVAREVPHPILMAHMADLRHDLVKGGEYCYRFIYGNTTYVFELYDL